MAFLAAGLLFCSVASAQRLDGYGTSGGKGPTGGIGDVLHPVLKAQSFITDGYVPSGPGQTRQLAIGPAPVFAPTTPATTSRRRVVVDSTAAGAQQEMLGFGHAWTDSTVQVFNELEPALLDKLMHELFGQDGNNMGFMRHTIGSSDLSGSQYSYDDNGGYNTGKPDPTLSKFSLGTAGTAMLNLISKMNDIKGDVFLYGAPWSYPGWMKKNGLFVAPQGSYSTDNSLSPSYFAQAIKYIEDYVDAFKAKGVQINGISLQNEPLNYQGGYPTMLLQALDEAKLLNVGLGAAMKQRGVKVMAYDHNTDRPDYPEDVIQTAPNYVDAVAWHCYQGPVANYSVLADFHNHHSSTPQFMTECSNTGVQVGTNNFWIAQNFLPSIRYGASGGSFWVLATDSQYGPHSPTGGCTTCSGSIFVNSSSVYEKTIDYYMMGQFSRFIRRGGINHHITAGLEGSGTDWASQFFAIAVQNPDGGWAVVMLNSFPKDQDIELDFKASGFSWTGTIPKSSVVTWLLPSDAVALGHLSGYPSSIIPISKPAYISSSMTVSTIPTATSTLSSILPPHSHTSALPSSLIPTAPSGWIRKSRPSSLHSGTASHRLSSASRSIQSVQPSGPVSAWPAASSGYVHGPPMSDQRSSSVYAKFRTRIHSSWPEQSAVHETSL